MGITWLPREGAAEPCKFIQQDDQLCFRFVMNVSRYMVALSYLSDGLGAMAWLDWTTAINKKKSKVRIYSSLPKIQTQYSWYIWIPSTHGQSLK